MAAAKFELYYSWLQYRWRLRAENGEIIAQGESFFQAAKAKHSIERVRALAPGALLVDRTDGRKMLAGLVRRGR